MSSRKSRWMACAASQRSLIRIIDRAGCASLRFAGVECLFVERSLQSDPIAEAAPVDADLFGIY